MKTHIRIAMAVCALVLGAVPALAVAANGNSGSAPGHSHTTTTGTSTNPATPPNGHAYGVLCANQSKQHVAGQKGTPFSQCVTAMAKVAHGKTSNPHTACAAMSKKHEKGHSGTPYSRCVSAAAKLLASKSAPTS